MTTLRLSRMGNIQILLRDLHNHLCEGQGDCDIICDDGPVRVHGHILVTLSPLLSAIITPSTDTNIVIPGTSRDDVQAFLSLVYLGEVNIAPSSLASVESLADRFQIALVKQCSAVISVLNKTQKFLCNCGQHFSNIIVKIE